MANVYTQTLDVPARSRNNRIYANSGQSFLSASALTASPVTPPTATPIPPFPVPFTATKTPSLTSYSTVYAPVYGQFPKITLITLDASNNRIERSEKPVYNMTLQDGSIDDTISSITFDLAIAETGFIIIQ